MTEYKCEECNKIFDSEDAFNQHNQAKHKSEEKPKRNLNIKKYWPAVVLILIIIGAAYLMTNKPKYDIKLSDSDHIKGSGILEVVEFSDFQCPACGYAYPKIKNFLQQYPTKIKFVYKHFPLPDHKFALKAAEASECAADQNKFWEYHDKLFENQKFLTVSDLKKYAGEIVGLNTEDFNACLDSGAMVSRVSGGYSEGQSLGVDGTPTFFMNGKQYTGYTQEFENDLLKQVTGV